LDISPFFFTYAWYSIVLLLGEITQSLSYSDISRDVGSWSSYQSLKDFAMSSYFKGVDCTVGTCIFVEFQQGLQGKEEKLHKCG
jgi:hypothetical protein